MSRYNIYHNQYLKHKAKCKIHINNISNKWLNKKFNSLIKPSKTWFYQDKTYNNKINYNILLTKNSNLLSFLRWETK